MAFTPEELEAMRLADEQIDQEFVLTDEEFYASRELDRESKDSSVDEKTLLDRKRYRAYYQRNKERIKARSKAYYHANKEKCRAAQKAWRERNPGDRHRDRTPNQARLEARERGESSAKRYYENNKEKIAARNKAWREANPGYSQEWKAKNPDKVRAYARIWYERNREKKLAYNKAYYQRRREELRCLQETTATPNAAP